MAAIIDLTRRGPGVRERARRAWSGNERAWAAVVVCALVAGSLALRSGQLQFRYWIDEAISVGIASHPLARLPALLRQDGSPPLYYLLLHWWIALAGPGETATHLLSLLFAVACVPAAYLGAAGLFGRRAGIFAAVLAAGLPFLTYYGQETRMYSLVALESLAGSASFVLAFVHRRRGWPVLFGLTLAAMLYTHNWALFFALAAVVAFAGLLLATRRAGTDRGRALARGGPTRGGLKREGAIGFGLAAALFAPWLPSLLYQAGHTGAPWALPPTIWSVTQGLYFVSGGRGAAVALALAAGSGLATLRAGSGAGSGFATLRARSGAGSGLATLGPARAGETVRAATCLAVLGFGTLAIAWLYAKTTPSWSARYLAVTVGPLILLCALGLARARGLGVAALVLVCCFWVLDPRPSSPYSKSNVAAVAATLGRMAGPGALVLSTQPEQVPTLAHYLPRSDRFASPLGVAADPTVMDWRDALARFERSRVLTALAPLIGALHPGSRVLLVTPTSFQSQPRWMALIRRSSRRWTLYLERDRALRRIASGAPRAQGAGVNVRGQLFVVVGRG
ncbi:MAG TPA: glycosyltransferase family 39 protein [Solirubrobacteraceae bacterium]|nr:glycosyltransferase family 39 protein [Solirubrobacteraceae bacterium]